MEYQVDIGSAQNDYSPKDLIVAHQTAARKGVPNKAENIAIFDNLNVRKYHVDIDGARFTRDGVSIDYASNDYIGHCRDLKLFYKKYVGEELLHLFVSYTDMKTKYPIQIIDLRFHFDHIIHKKIPLFEHYRGATNIARLCMILNRHREIKMISDGVKITDVTGI